MKIIAIFVCMSFFFLNAPARSAPLKLKKIATALFCCFRGGETVYSVNPPEVASRSDTLANASKTEQIVLVTERQSRENYKVEIDFNIDPKTGKVEISVAHDRSSSVKFHAGPGLVLQRPVVPTCTDCGCVIE